MRGRPPTPTAIRELEGNPQKRPMPKDEPRPDPTMPACPPGLSAAARKAWDRLAPEMNRVGILTKLDADALESYCRLYAFVRECWRDVAKTGGPVIEVNDKPTTNPHLRHARDAEQMLHKLRSEIGLNATSRTRISTDPVSDEDELAKFLKFTG